MYMYSSTLGLPSDGDEDEIELDLLEMTFFRFSSQMVRYLQATKCNVYQSIDERGIQMKIKELLEAGCNRKELLDKIIGYFWTLAFSITSSDEFANQRSGAFGYVFCKSAKKLPCGKE